jgi:hypothetical protein
MELHRPNDFQTTKEIADRADTSIFQATRFSRGRGGPSIETASENWPRHDDEAMKLGSARLTDSELEKYTKEGKCFRCGQKVIGPTSTMRMGHRQKAIQPWPWTARERRKLPRENKNRNEKRQKETYLRIIFSVDAMKEKHGSEDDEHGKISSSETATEKYQNETETEKRQKDFCKAENALNLQYKYQACTNYNSAEKSCMTGRASEKIKLPTIADYGMEGDESLHVCCVKHAHVSPT